MPYQQLEKYIKILFQKISSSDMLYGMHLRAFFLSGLSGILISLALPNELFPLGSPILGLVCLAPLLHAAMIVPERRTVALMFGLFGAVSTAAGNYWLFFFKDFAFWTIGSVSLAYSLIYAVIGVVIWRFSAPGPARPFLVALAWMVFEYIKAGGYLGYPWGLMAYPFNDLLPLLQVADLAGIWPISAWAVLANCLLAEYLDLRSSAPATVCRPPVGRPALLRAVLFFLLLTASFFVYGQLRMSSTIPSLGNFRLVLVQQNTDPWQEGKEDQALRASQTLTRTGLRQAGSRADLVVWSETALFTPYAGYEYLYETRPKSDPFPGFLREIGVPLLTGAPIVTGRAPLAIMNGALLLAPDGRTIETYGKQHPVPMAEHVPFWDAPPVQWLFKNVIGLHSIWTLGDRATVFSLTLKDGRSLRFSVPICFEDAFAYLGRRFINEGADILINITNDAWSRTNSAQYQHFAAARFRSIELKRVLVRSTNAGYTCVIDPFGTVLADLPMFEPASLVIDVPVSREASATTYLLFGDYLPVLAAALLTFLLVRPLLRRRPARRA
jgi:apolipoprotein N-acyltransferase